jgi:hypothetical protein
MAASTPGNTTANAAALAAFRSDLFGCLTARADALFELVDGLCSPVHVDSLAHVTLAPSVRRGHGAAYAALTHGAVDGEGIRDVLAAQRPTDWLPDFAVDTTTWPRVYAMCSPERSHYYHPSRHMGGHPVVAGWCYQWLVGLSGVADSWTAPMDAQRLKPGDNPSSVAVRQIEQVLPRLGPLKAEPLFVFDAGYDLVHLAHELRGENVQLLVRVRSDRKFYTRVQRTSMGYDRSRAGTGGGRPPLHGPVFRCRVPATWSIPDYTFAVEHVRFGRMQAQAWGHVYPRQRRYYNRDGTMAPVEGSIIRVQVERMPGDRGSRENTMWLWWAGPRGSAPDLNRIVHAYLRRFDVEHMFRFLKHVLGWNTPKLRSPEQADRWTWLIAAAITQLRLARPLITDHRLPWQPPLSTQKMTPGRVRAGFGLLVQTLSSPATNPKPNRPGPGRPTGRLSRPAPRFPVHKLTKRGLGVTVQRR